MKLAEIFWHDLPATRLGEFNGRIKCPCEVEFWQIVESFFPEGHGKIVVDLGCGPGIKALTCAVAGAQVRGFDIRASSIRHAAENLRQTQARLPAKSLHVQFEQQDLQLGIAQISAHAVDVVLIVEVLEHLTNYAHILSEIYRILKPGGFVMLTTPNKDLHEKDADEAVYGEKAYGHVREFDLEELTTVVQQAGLTIHRRGYLNTPACKKLCRWIHPWMIRDHGFLQGRAHITGDVIGIRTLGFLQPVYNFAFPLISAVIAGYNRVIFPALRRLVASPSPDAPGLSLFVVATKGPVE